MSDQRQQAIKNVQAWPRRAGRAELLKHLRGERLTRAEAIKARCYECIQGEDPRPCTVVTCALTTYCQWNKQGIDGDEDLIDSAA